MEYFFNGLWTFLDVVSIFLFWSAFLTCKKTKRQCMITLLILWGCGILNASFIHIQLIKQVLSIFMFLAASIYLYKGSWYQYLLFVALGLIMNGAIDMLFLYGTSAILRLSYSALVWRRLTYVITASISKLVSVLVTWIIFRIRKEAQGQPIQKKWLLLSLSFPIVSFSMMLVVFNGNQNAEDLSTSAFAFSCFIIAANIAIIYLIRIMEKSTREMQENILLHQRMDIQTGSIAALEKSYRKQRQLTHDFQNQLQTIYDLLLRDDPSAAKEYIQQLQGMQTTRILAINSHNSIVDAVLNHKYQSAKEMGIDFQVHVTNLSQIRIDMNSMVVLLSNLLDNAIEACAKIQTSRTIQCSILAEDTVFISIRNTSAPVAIIGDTIPTTKEPREEHGFGIPHVLLILKQLQAEYSFAYEDGWFEFVAEIPAAATPTP